MNRWLAAGVLGLAAAGMTGVVGCGPSEEQVEMAESPQARGLQALGDAYRTISLVNKRPPKDIRELEQAAAAAPGGLGFAPDEVVVFWGAELTDLSEEPGKVPSDRVLAYEKAVPETGGYVLMLDRTIKKMTPEEFQAAPRRTSPEPRAE